MSGGISIIWDAACSGHGTCVIAAHLSLHSRNAPVIERGSHAGSENLFRGV